MPEPVDVIDTGEFSGCDISLRISDTQTREFHCETPLRILKGRRMTCLATGRQKRYVVKVFPDRRRSLYEYDREVTGHDLLHNVSLDVPARIYHGPASGGVHIIVYQYLERARTLQEALFPAGRRPKKRIMMLLDLVIRLHRDELIHEDPHPGNFMVYQDRIYILDTAAIRKTPNKPIHERNFALFAAQFPYSWHIDELWVEKYANAFPAGPGAATAEELRVLVGQAQSRRESMMLKKIYRECSSFQVFSFLEGKMILDRARATPLLIDLLTDPLGLFDHDGFRMLKEGNTSTVGVIETDDGPLVFKRYNMTTLRHKLKRKLGESRASRSWRNAHRLEIRGIQTAKPVAFAEYYKGKARGVSIIVTGYVAGIHSADYFRDTNVSEEDRRRIAGCMLSQLAEMKRQKLTHGDLKATNFIVNDGKTWLIDLDGMQHHRRSQSFVRRHEADIMRFRKNWEGDTGTSALFESLYGKYDL